MLPIYTNYLTPTDYGIIALLTTISSVYELFLGARFGSAIPKFYYEMDDQKKKNTVVSTTLIITAIISSLGVIFFIVSADFLSKTFFDNHIHRGVVMLYGTLLLTTSLEAYYLALIRLHDKPKSFFLFSILKFLLQLLLNIYFLVYKGMAFEGVIYSNVIASYLFSAYSVYYCTRTSGIAVDLKLAKTIFYFTWPLWLAGSATVYLTFVIQYSIKINASLADVGLYQLAAKFAALITLLLWSPFNQWWQTERFKIANENEEYKIIFSRVFIIISTVMLIAAFAISLLGQTIISVMAEEKFQSASNLILPLCFSIILRQLNLFLNFSYLTKSKTMLLARQQYIKAVLLTIMLFPFTLWLGAFGAALAVLISQIIMFTISLIVGRGLFDLGIKVRLFYGFYFMTLLTCVCAILIRDVWVSEQYHFLYNVTLAIVFTAFAVPFLGYISKAGKESFVYLKENLIKKV